MFFVSIAKPVSSLVSAMFIFILLICIFSMILLIFKNYRETNEIKRLANFYNTCINNNQCTEVDDELRSKYIGMSKNIMFNRLELIWEPEFIYDDETEVCRVENTKVIIVNGYFKDNSVSRVPKRNYKIVFTNGKYYMNCIDNLIYWEKGTYWASFYKKRALKNARIDYTKW